MSSTEGATTSDTEGPVGGSEFRSVVSTGLKWSFLNHLVARIVSVASGIVMARLLAPEDFGVYATALLVVNILFGLNDLGLLLAVVRWRGDLRVAARTAMTLATGFSVVLYAVVFVAAEPYAEFMGSPESTAILRVICLTIILDGITTVPHGLIIRDFLQNRLAMSEFAAMPVSITVSIWLAISGAGAWSFALGYLAANLVTAALVLRWSPIRVWPGYNHAAAKWMLAYGVPLALTSLIEYLLLNTDYLVVGRVLGTAMLGVYVLAYNVSNWPVAIVSDAVRRVSIAGFARLEDDALDTVAEGFRRTFRVLVTLSLPMVICLALLAEPLIVTLYGEKWRDAGTVLTFLAILGGVRVAVGYVFDLLVGTGRTRLTLALKVGWLVALVPALVLAADRGGIRAVGFVHAAVALLVAAPLFLLGARKAGVDLAGMGRDLTRPLLAGAAASMVGWLLVQTVDNPYGQLALGGGAVIMTYAALVFSASDRAKVRARLPGSAGRRRDA